MNNKVGFNEFWDNLSLLSYDELINNTDHLLSENRSSTIFPIFRNQYTTTSVSFLSYWTKKHGNNVVLRLTARDSLGHCLKKTYDAITTYKSYTLTISDFFENINDGFCGSVEIEVFSKCRPRFTFPAISVLYHAENRSSVVHSCIRTYNIGEENKDYAIGFPQTGFDVELSPNNRNYICFFGGKASAYTLEIELSEARICKRYNVCIINENYAQSHFIYIEDIVEKDDLKLFTSPKCTIRHNLVDVFPRFYVGIINSELTPTLTHTFFDTSDTRSLEQNDKGVNLRARNPSPNELFDSAFSVPIYPLNQFESSLKTYAQNLPFEGEVIVSIHAPNGSRLFYKVLELEEVLRLSNVSDLCLNKFVLDAGLTQDRTVCLKMSFVGHVSPFPSRFKFGFNVRRVGSGVGTNICFSPVVINETTLSKPFNRRWFPIGGKKTFIASVHNTALTKRPNNQVQNCKLEFVNHKGLVLIREQQLECNASIFIDPSSDDELKSFLGELGGWCMVNTDTYHCDAFYFSMADRQIGGDHAY